MSILIIGFGGLIFLAGILLIINPGVLFNELQENSDKLWQQIAAVAVRLLLGALFIYQANDSKYPVAIEVIGWLTVFVAIVFAVIGRKNFTNLIIWATSLMQPLARIGGVLAICLGSFLIYAFV